MKNVDTKSKGGICQLTLSLFLIILQAVKRSHRRLGLAQKLMEQVHQSVIVIPIDEGTHIWVK